MKRLARAAVLLLLLLLLLPPGAAWAQAVSPPAGKAPMRRIAQLCPPGATGPGCRRPARRAVVSPGHAAPRRRNQAASSPGQAQAQALQRAAMGDLFGGRIIPPAILKIMADPRIEPVTAYIVWQAARRPIDEWTVRQLQQITEMIPTLAETGMPMPQIQALYKFLGLDPGDVFYPRIGQEWHDSSMRFDRGSDAAVAAISSADCNTDPDQMTVAVLRSCQSGGR